MPGRISLNTNIVLRSWDHARMVKATGDERIYVAASIIDSHHTLAKMTDSDRILQLECIYGESSSMPLTILSSTACALTLGIIPAYSATSVDLYVTIVDRAGNTYWSKRYAGQTQRIMGFAAIFMKTPGDDYVGSEMKHASAVLTALYQQAFADVRTLDIVSLHRLP